MKTVRLVLVVLVVAGMALAGGIALDTSTRFEFTDCAAGGSAAQTVTGGYTYLLRVTDSDVSLCIAESGATCAAGGEKFPMGTVLLLTVPGASKSMACRSAGSAGDVALTRAY